MAEQKCNAQQERFVDEYMEDFNGKQAAIRAGYSARSAGPMASKLLTLPHIQAALKARRDKAAAKFELSRDAVLDEYAKLAFADPRNFFREDGTLKRVTELDDRTAAALAHFEVLEEFAGSGEDRMQVGYTTKVKWADKKAALDSICRVMGWNQDKLQHDASNPLLELLKQIGGSGFKPVGAGQPERDDQ